MHACVWTWGLLHEEEKEGARPFICQLFCCQRITIICRRLLLPAVLDHDEFVKKNEKEIEPSRPPARRSKHARPALSPAVADALLFVYIMMFMLCKFCSLFGGT
jgi:hypothetical protein